MTEELQPLQSKELCRVHWPILLKLMRRAYFRWVMSVFTYVGYAVLFRFLEIAGLLYQFSFKATLL